MFKVTVKKNGVMTHARDDFSSLEEAQAFIAKQESKKTFGQPAQIIKTQVETSPAVLAEDGSVLQEAVIEIQEQHIPSDYEIVIEDITAKLAQDQINAEALAFLAESDFYIIRQLDSGVPCPEEIKAQRQAARERIVK
jgi:hypothetical protein